MTKFLITAAIIIGALEVIVAGYSVVLAKNSQPNALMRPGQIELWEKIAIGVFMVFGLQLMAMILAFFGDIRPALRVANKVIAAVFICLNVLIFLWFFSDLFGGIELSEVLIPFSAAVCGNFFVKSWSNNLPKPNILSATENSKAS